MRRAVQAAIDDGEIVRCARCTVRILLGVPWHLDHTDDRTGYLGPSCADCNAKAAAAKARRSRE